MVKTVKKQNLYQELAEAEHEATQRMKPIKDVIERASVGQLPEDQQVLKAVLECAERFMFLTSYIRVKLDAGMDAEIPSALREMFDDGEEDDFETYYPPLMDAYEAIKKVEQLYHRINWERE